MTKKKFQDPADTLRNVLPDIEELDEARGENRAEIYREAIGYLEDYELFIFGLREIKAYFGDSTGARKHIPKGSEADVK